MATSLKEWKLDDEKFVNLLEKLIGECRFLQNNPPEWVPKEDRAVRHVLDVLEPYRAVSRRSPLLPPLPHLTALLLATLLLPSTCCSAATASSTSRHHLSLRHEPNTRTAHPHPHLNLPAAQKDAPLTLDDDDAIFRTHWKGGSSTLKRSVPSTLPLLTDALPSSQPLPVDAPLTITETPQLTQTKGPAVTPAVTPEVTHTVTPGVTPTVTPTPWPAQFHAVLFQNRSASLALTDLWYDWPAGRNLNAIHAQLSGRTLFDVEWNNGTSFYFDKSQRTCKTVTFPVGILSPDWLRGASLVGQEVVDSRFSCRVWTKAGFILYYEDVETGWPVKWIFLASQASFHVLQFTPHATLPDEEWQAPPFCFNSSSAASALPVTHEGKATA